jgi:hypothetical protein
VSKFKGTFFFAALVCGALFGFAYAAADNPRLWGQGAYEAAGGIAVLILVITPLLAHRSLPVWKRALLSAALFVLVNAVWIGGIFATDFKLLGPIRVM